jgi:hypothetical protein
VRPVVRRELLVERRVLLPLVVERRVLLVERRVPLLVRRVLDWVAIVVLLLLCAPGWSGSKVVSSNDSKTVAGERVFVNLKGVTWVTEAWPMPAAAVAAPGARVDSGS